MQYALLLWPHANIRYMEALQKLAKCELSCLLKALQIDAPIEVQTLGGAPFLTFEAQPLNEAAFRALSGLSSFYLIAEKENGCLKPLTPAYPWYLPADAAEVLKYKGKTNASFTSLMINCALTASDFFNSGEALTVLDPMCGKGTSLYCAMRMGHHATGIEIDKKDWKEAGDYFARYLQLHKYKHKKKAASLTLPVLPAAPVEGASRTELISQVPATVENAHVRQIVLTPKGDTHLTPENPSVEFAVECLPAGAPEQELTYRILNYLGVDSFAATVETIPGGCIVTAQGDGKLYLRASVKNGYEHARVLIISTEGDTDRENYNRVVFGQD